MPYSGTMAGTADDLPRPFRGKLRARSRAVKGSKRRDKDGSRSAVTEDTSTSKSESDQRWCDWMNALAGFDLEITAPGPAEQSRTAPARTSQVKPKPRPCSARLVLQPVNSCIESLHLTMLFVLLVLEPNRNTANKVGWLTPKSEPVVCS